MSDNPFDIAWAAGFIDGDGSITLNLSKGSRRISTLTVVLRAAGVDRRPLDELARILGGGVTFYSYSEANVSSSREGCWLWHLNGRSAVEALEVLQPFLILKGAQARLAKGAYTQVQAQVAGLVGRKYKYPEKVCALRERLYRTMLCLNKGNPATEGSSALSV